MQMLKGMKMISHKGNPMSFFSSNPNFAEEIIRRNTIGEGQKNVLDTKLVLKKENGFQQEMFFEMMLQLLMQLKGIGAAHSVHLTQNILKQEIIRQIQNQIYLVNHQFFHGEIKQVFQQMTETSMFEDEMQLDSVIELLQTELKKNELHHNSIKSNILWNHWTAGNIVMSERIQRYFSLQNNDFFRIFRDLHNVSLLEQKVEFDHLFSFYLERQRFHFPVSLLTRQWGETKQSFQNNVRNEKVYRKLFDVSFMEGKLLHLQGWDSDSSVLYRRDRTSQPLQSIAFHREMWYLKKQKYNIISKISQRQNDIKTIQNENTRDIRIKQNYISDGEFPVFQEQQSFFNESYIYHKLKESPLEEQKNNVATSVYELISKHTDYFHLIQNIKNLRHSFEIQTKKGFHQSSSLFQSRQWIPSFQQVLFYYSRKEREMESLKYDHSAFWNREKHMAKVFSSEQRSIGKNIFSIIREFHKKQALTMEDIFFHYNSKKYKAHSVIQKKQFETNRKNSNKSFVNQNFIENMELQQGLSTAFFVLHNDFLQSFYHSIGGVKVNRELKLQYNSSQKSGDVGRENQISTFINPYYRVKNSWFMGEKGIERFAFLMSKIDLIEFAYQLAKKNVFHHHKKQTVMEFQQNKFQHLSYFELQNSFDMRRKSRENAGVEKSDSDFVMDRNDMLVAYHWFDTTEQNSFFNKKEANYFNSPDWHRFNTRYAFFSQKWKQMFHMQQLYYREKNAKKIMDVLKTDSFYFQGKKGSLKQPGKGFMPHLEKAVLHKLNTIQNSVFHPSEHFLQETFLAAEKLDLKSENREKAWDSIKSFYQRFYSFKRQQKHHLEIYGKTQSYNEGVKIRQNNLKYDIIGENFEYKPVITLQRNVWSIVANGFHRDMYHTFFQEVLKQNLSMIEKISHSSLILIRQLRGTYGFDVPKQPMAIFNESSYFLKPRINDVPESRKKDIYKLEKNWDSALFYHILWGNMGIDIIENRSPLQIKKSTNHFYDPWQRQLLSMKKVEWENDIVQAGKQYIALHSKLLRMIQPKSTTDGQRGKNLSYNTSAYITSNITNKMFDRQVKNLYWKDVLQTKREHIIQDLVELMGHQQFYKHFLKKIYLNNSLLIETIVEKKKEMNLVFQKMSEIVHQQNSQRHTLDNDLQGKTKIIQRNQMKMESKRIEDEFFRQHRQIHQLKNDLHEKMRIIQQTHMKSETKKISDEFYRQYRKNLQLKNRFQTGIREDTLKQTVSAIEKKSKLFHWQFVKNLHLTYGLQKVLKIEERSQMELVTQRVAQMFHLWYRKKQHLENELQTELRTLELTEEKPVFQGVSEIFYRQYQKKLAVENADGKEIPSQKQRQPIAQENLLQYRQRDDLISEIETKVTHSVMEKMEQEWAARWKTEKNVEEVPQHNISYIEATASPVSEKNISDLDDRTPVWDMDALYEKIYERIERTLRMERRKIGR